MVVGYVCGLRSKVKQLVDSEYFQRGILFAILVNTLSMGIEYHNQVKHCLRGPPVSVLWTNWRDTSCFLCCISHDNMTACHIMAMRQNKKHYN